MLRYALRRAVWAVPTLIGVSLIVFLLTTLMPDPALQPGDQQSALLMIDPARFDALVEMRRRRFLDLPRFLNPQPQDVRARAEDAMLHLITGDSEAPIAAHAVAAMGGAALPYVLPKLDNLSPGARGRVAVALAPVAERMGLGDNTDLRDSEEAAVFWAHFWEDRALDFTGPAVRRSVHRVILHGSALRERDLVLVDTFALGEAILAMGQVKDRPGLMRLTALAAHATGRGMEITEASDEAYARGAVADWQSWWYVHKTDFAPLEGAERVAATLTETRYGKWILGAATGELGLSARDGQPIADKLRARAPVTLTMTALAMLLSFALAIPIGVVSAWRRGRTVDITMAFVLFAVYSLPTFWIAQVLIQVTRKSAGTEWSLALPVVALAVGSLASLSRYQRASMIDVLGQDYIRTARAKGLSTFRVLVVHALRNALMPMMTLAGLQFPALLGGAFVVEEVFGLPGIGYETLRAVEAHDSPWLVVAVLLSAVVTTTALIASDVGYGLIDPRLRESLGHRRGTLQ